MAAVRIVNMRDEYAHGGADVALSRPLIDAITDRLSRGEQTVVLLNRRGFAVVVFCRQCGGVARVPALQRVAHVSQGAPAVQCHYCNYATAVRGDADPAAASTWSSPGSAPSGWRRSPVAVPRRPRRARRPRHDPPAGAITRVLESVGRGDIDILVGTQMIAKGTTFRP